VAVKIQLRRGTAAEWTGANPVLMAGEVGVDTTNNNYRIGDGTTNWDDLPIATGEAAPEVKIEYSADGSTGWSATFTPGTHYYIRFSVDDGSTWTDGYKFIGDDGEEYIHPATVQCDASTGDNFNSSGTYADLRAQATTNDDVGLSNVTNHKQARSTDGYDIQKNGTDGAGIINFKT